MILVICFISTFKNLLNVKLLKKIHYQCKCDL